MTPRSMLGVVLSSIIYVRASLAFADPAATLQIPATTSRHNSERRIREIFSADFSKARNPKEQAALASALIGHSRDTQDPSDAFALLETARSLSVTAGDLAIANQAIEALEARYRIDAAALRVKTLEELAARASGPTVGPVIDALLSAAVQMAEEGDTAQAEQLLKTAAHAARKAHDKPRQDAVLGELKEIRKQAKAAEKIAPLVQRLEADPNDREAATLLGKHRCFEEGDWEAGLPLLARGDDATLASLAVAELRSPSDTMLLGDAWWVYAETVQGQECDHAAGRAVGHYRSALEQMTGLEKVRLEKRIADFEKKRANLPGAAGTARPPGAVFWLDATSVGAILDLEGKPIKIRAAEPPSLGVWKDAQLPSLAASAARGSAPFLANGALGGNPGIEFRGRQLLLAKAPLPEVGALMMVAESATPATAGCLLGSAKSPATVDCWTRQDGAIWFTIFPKKGEAKRFNTDPSSFQPGEPFLLTISWPKPFLLRVNGKQKVSRNDCPDDVRATDQFVIGANDMGARYPFSGLIGEVLIFDKILSPDEMMRLEAALMQKWRIRP